MHESLASWGEALIPELEAVFARAVRLRDQADREKTLPARRAS